MQTNKSLLLWDNDGVLVDTELLYYEASSEALSELGVDLSIQDFIDISLNNGKSVLELPKTKNLTSDQMNALRTRRNDLYARKLKEGVSVPGGIRETLETLRGWINMAIVTSCRRDHFNLIHQQTDLLHFFEFTLTREDYIHSKPHPEPYLLALDRAGHQAADALVIEDSPRGVASAHSAGIQSVAISHPLNNNADLSEADWIISNPTEIIPLLLKL